MESLRSYWAPRYWPAWVLVGWFRLTASLPWRPAIRLHEAIGRVCWRLMGRQRRIVERNVEIGFPELDSRGVQDLVRRHFESLGACLAETAFSWFGKVGDKLTDFEMEGEEHVFAALAKGRGVILYTGHFTPVEICAPSLKATFPLFTFMFHPRRNALLNEVQRRGRMHSAHLGFASNNVRAMLKALKDNAVVWYAPDQKLSGRNSTVLPFLGQSTIASTATCRLARVSGAAVVPFFYRRLPDDSGYGLRFEPEIEGIGAGDEIEGTRRLLEVLEGFVRECPEQYAWSHKRPKQRPPDSEVAPGPESRDAKESQPCEFRDGVS